MAASVKIFVASLMVASVVKDDGAHSCSLRVHKTPYPSDVDPMDAAAAPCAWPARGPPQRRPGHPGEPAADASIPSNWPPGSEPGPSGTDYGRLLAGLLLLLRGYAPVPSRPADSARLGRQQVEQLLTVLLTGPVAVPSPDAAAPAASVPADSPTGTTPATVPESPATVPGPPATVPGPPPTVAAPASPTVSGPPTTALPPANTTST